ncbi:Vacuolar morphogenesis protein 6 [Malassezia sp. CBS 17886]|nr:Vacuolar morphogenesis protein 6 [Malassezia sp. CBS 17886]
MAPLYTTRVVGSAPDGACALACAGGGAGGADGGADPVLYVGTSAGALSPLRAGDAPVASPPPPAARRAVEHVCAVPETDLLAYVSDARAFVVRQGALADPVRLDAARGARCAAAAAWVETLPRARAPHAAPQRTGFPQHARAAGLRGMDELARERRPADGTRSVRVSMLAVGCRRHLAVYRWVDGAFWDVRTVHVPRTPATVAVLGGAAVFAGCALGDYLRVSIAPVAGGGEGGAGARGGGHDGAEDAGGDPRDGGAAEHGGAAAAHGDVPTAPLAALNDAAYHDAAEWPLYAVTLPFSTPGAPARTSTWSLMGRGRAAVPHTVVVGAGILLAFEHGGVFFDGDGRVARAQQLVWDAPPLDMVAGRACLVLVPAPPPKGEAAAAVAVYMSASLRPVQCVPAGSAGAWHSLAAAPDGAHVYALAAGAHTRAEVVALDARAWREQLDELVADGAVREALALLGAVDAGARGGVGGGGDDAADVASHRRHMQALVALQAFEDGAYDAAVDSFIDLDMNPARVLALYPSSVAGTLAAPREQWAALFGGGGGAADGRGSPVDAAPLPHSAPLPPRAPLPPNAPPHPAPATSAPASPRAPAPPSAPRALDGLARFLTDRRRIAKTLLDARTCAAPRAALGASAAALAAAPLYVSLGGDTPTPTLAAAAHVVDTALFKTFLHTKPGLVGPLCRVENWCEVAELEALLRAHGKYDELVSLYRGKRMHTEALALLRERAAHVDDPADAVAPTVQYLHTLAHEDADLVLASARWVLQTAPRAGMAIFTGDAAAARALPWLRVAEELERVGAALCIEYLRFLVDLDDGEPLVHTKLACLPEGTLDLLAGTSACMYGARAQTPAATRRDPAMRHLRHQTIPLGVACSRPVAFPFTDLPSPADATLVAFLRESTQYDADKVLAALPRRPAMPTARTILLGRLGRHNEALGLFVDELDDVRAAEDYCQEHRRAHPRIFHTLLELVLTRHGDVPARLLARHAGALDIDAVLPLLPPHRGVADIRTYLTKALRAQSAARCRTHVLCAVTRAREADVDRARHVIVGEARTCARCQRRLGNAVLAVVPATGATMHYYCAMARRGGRAD